MASYHTSEGENIMSSRLESPATTSDICERKRYRKVLSCYDCRRRKLLCDRGMPACGRCVKGGYASECLYIEDSSEVAVFERQTTKPTKLSLSKLRSQRGGDRSRTASATPDSVKSRLEYQDQRIKSLKAALAERDKSGEPEMTEAVMLKSCLCPPSPDSESDFDETESMDLDRASSEHRGGAFKTQFHGATHPGALIPYVSELHRFTLETLREFPLLGSDGKSARRLERASRASKLRGVSDAKLRSLMPSRAEVDVLVQVYLDSYDLIYHVFHTPSFWDEYEGMWANLAAGDAHFVAIVLLMTTAARCLAKQQPLSPLTSAPVALGEVDDAIVSVEDWLLMQSQKHVTAADFQIRVLLVIAKQACAYKTKRSWGGVGSLVRFCMAAGLHRNPDTIRKPTSLLDRELRRRIWAAATELELQISFDRGMVSCPWLVQSDTSAPSNVHDDDLSHATRAVPGRTAEEFTPTSYLAAARESIALRSALNTHLNSIQQGMDPADVKKYTEELEAQLLKVPQWLDPRSEVPRAKLELNLRQFLLVLHERCFRQAPSGAARDFSMLSMIEQAHKMIDVHAALTSRGKFALQLIRADQLRAAFAVCHVASMEAEHRQRQRQLSPVLQKAVDQAVHSVLPRAIEMITDKVVCFGREQRQLWVLLAANGYMKSCREPARRRAYMQEAIEKLTAPYCKIIANQQDAASMPVDHMVQADALGSSSGFGLTDQGMDSTALEVEAFLLSGDWGFDYSQIALPFVESSW